MLNDDIKCATTVTTWNPEELIDGHGCGDRLAVVLLNRPILLDKAYFRHVWNSATVRVSVDGGTNRWVDFVKNNLSQASQIKPPDLVTGDFDSCNEESLEYVKQLNCTIVKTMDQNATDFTKSLQVLKAYGFEKRIDRVLAFSESSGRLDQIMANINTLFLARTLLPDAVIYLRSSNSLTWLLAPGEHSLSIPARLVSEKIWCALVPIGESCRCTTEGLRWNIDRSRVMQFGTLVSTSNTYASPLVRIANDAPVLWSMGTIPKDM